MCFSPFICSVSLLVIFLSCNVHLAAIACTDQSSPPGRGERRDPCISADACHQKGYTREQEETTAKQRHMRAEKHIKSTTLSNLRKITPPLLRIRFY